MSIDDKVVSDIKRAKADCPLSTNALEKAETFYENLLASNPKETYERVYQHHFALKEYTEFYKTPLISHHIWLTNINKPREAIEKDIDNLKHTISILDQDNDAWEHIFWTNCDSCIPKTLASLEPINIKVKNISAIKDILISYDDVIGLAKKNLFGLAADLLRLDIVNQFGGYYSDLNFVTEKSPINFMKHADFFAYMVYGHLRVENYAFGSSHSHPILDEAINVILSSLQEENFLKINLKSSGCKASNITNWLYYCSFSLSVIKNANLYGTKDLIFHTNFEVISEFEDELISHEKNITSDRKYTEKFVYKECALDQQQKEDEFLEKQYIPTVELEEDFVTYFDYNGVCAADDFGIDGSAHSWDVEVVQTTLLDYILGN